VCKATVLYTSFALALSFICNQVLTSHQWPTVAAAAAAWRAGALLVFGWSAGAHMLEIVYTERVALADDSDIAPTAPLLAALQHKDPIVQVGQCASMNMCRTHKGEGG
jgi:peptidase E